MSRAGVFDHDSGSIEIETRFDISEVVVQLVDLGKLTGRGKLVRCTSVVNRVEKVGANSLPQPTSLTLRVHTTPVVTEVVDPVEQATLKELFGCELGNGRHLPDWVTATVRTNLGIGINGDHGAISAPQKP